MHGEALAHFVSGEGEGGEQTQRVVLVDASIGGIGVRAEAPVQVGATFSLFPDKVRRSSWEGAVVRCVRDGDGYTLGLELLVAAA